MIKGNKDSTYYITCNNNTLISILSEKFRMPQGYVEVYPKFITAIKLMHPADEWLVGLSIPEDRITSAGIQCKDGLPTDWVRIVMRTQDILNELI